MVRLSETYFFQHHRAVSLRILLLLLLGLRLHAQQKTDDAGRMFATYSGTDSLLTNASPYLIVRYGDASCIPPYRSLLVRELGPNLAIFRNSTVLLSPTKSGCRLESAPANNLWKLSPQLTGSLEQMLSRPNEIRTFSLLADDMVRFTKKIRNEGLPVEFISVFSDANAAQVRCSVGVLFSRLLAYPELLFAGISEVPMPDILVNGFFRNINRLNLVDAVLSDANGSGIVIGIKEKKPDILDIDLRQRVLSSELADPAIDNHATIVATLAGGAGNSFLLGRGVASRAAFFPSSFSNLLPDSTGLLLAKRVTVQTHAYGTLIQPFYGAEALGYDLQSYQQTELQHVFSSGNRGTEPAGSGRYANLAGFGNLTGNFKMAKNVLTVAALDTSGRVAAFSSSGPLYDGRLGPQLAALGPTGTSEAAALVSGAVAVLQQLHRDSFNQVPPASLVRALLFTGADDIDAPGIDYRTGFGSLNLYRSAVLLQQKQFDGSLLGHAENWSSIITIPDSAAELKITLCWTDTSASANALQALVNDLDLELIQLNSGTVYRPWCLNDQPQADSLGLTAVRRKDGLNNAEQVSIRLPESGAYRIRVTAAQIATGQPQPFHIAWQIDTLNTFRFINPASGEDINGSEQSVLRIAWDCTPADTDAVGKLAVRFDSGMPWREISGNIPLSRRRFDWPLPDTVTAAQWRMQTDFGTFFSGRMLLAPLTRVQVDYLCADSLRLSWPALRMASGYRVFALGDSAYLGDYASVSDSFVVIRRTEQTPRVFAVEPLIPDGLKATRSYAVDVTDQGVDCFYQALVAETAGDRVKLTLSLNYLSETDSLVFYRITTSGNPLNRLAMLLPANGPGGYSVYDDDPASGVNYYRVFIYKSGGIVNTEIVSLLHNGKLPVWVYPNPVRRGQRLNILVKESISEGILQLSDATGRLLGSFPFNVATGINTAAFAPGLYFYRMTGTDGRNLASGKIIIQ